MSSVIYPKNKTTLLGRSYDILEDAADNPASPRLLMSDKRQGRNSPTSLLTIEQAESEVKKNPQNNLSKYIIGLKTSIITLSACELSSTSEIDGLRKQTNGEPIHYFWAPAIRKGKWKHPTQNVELDITQERMGKWVKNLHRAPEHFKGSEHSKGSGFFEFMHTI